MLGAIFDAGSPITGMRPYYWHEALLLAPGSITGSRPHYWLQASLLAPGLISTFLVTLCRFDDKPVVSVSGSAFYTPRISYGDSQTVICACF